MRSSLTKAYLSDKGTPTLSDLRWSRILEKVLNTISATDLLQKVKKTFTLGFFQMILSDPNICAYQVYFRKENSIVFDDSRGRRRERLGGVTKNSHVPTDYADKLGGGHNDAQRSSADGSKVDNLPQLAESS